MLRTFKSFLHNIYSENTIFGVILTAIVAFFLELFPFGDKVDDFKSSVLYIFVIVILLEVYSIRFKISKIENIMDEKYEDVDTLRNIKSNSQIDQEFYRRYDDLKRQIRELALGRYRVESLNVKFQLVLLIQTLQLVSDQ